MKIEKKHIYITGSNRGIGFALAKRAASLGGVLYLVNRSEVSAEKVEELKKAGAPSVHQISLDLLSTDSINDFLKHLQNQQVDIFVNNAGLLTGGLIENQKVDDIYNMLQVNLRALIHICHGLVPIMLKQKTGYIVNNASVSGKMFFPCASTYAASKAGVVAFTEALSQELHGTGVKTLLMITPGVKTQMYDDISKLYGENLDLSFLNYIPAESWAHRVFECIEKEKSICWPQGSSRFGVWLGHHFPNVFKNIVKSKFHR